MDYKKLLDSAFVLPEELWEDWTRDQIVCKRQANARLGDWN